MKFKLLLDMPTSYKSCHIDRLVLKPILEQLSPYFEDLKVKKIKSKKRGNPVLAYEFTWKKEVTGTYDPDKFNKPKPEPKKASKSKSSKKTNVPKWSNSDYKNETTDEEKAELEKKKAEMMARLNKKVDEGLEKLNNAEPYKK